MPQLHLYVPDTTAELLKRRAEERGLTLSKYLAEVVREEVDDEEWPEGFFEDVLGACGRVSSGGRHKDSMRDVKISRITSTRGLEVSSRHRRRHSSHQR